MSQVCAICDSVLVASEAVTVSRGKKTLSEQSRSLGDGLWRKIDSMHTLTIHENCRKIYMRKKKAENDVNHDSDTPASAGISLRSGAVSESNETFDFKRHCLFCAEECYKSAIKRCNRMFRTIRTLHIKENIITQCKVRNDHWSNLVFTRISTCIDLVASEGRYHKMCHDNFFKTSKTAQPGRPSEKICEEAFNELCAYIDDNLELCQFSLSDLHQKMEDYLPDDKKNCMCSKTHVKDMIIKHYPDRIKVTVVGKILVFTFKEYAEKILNDQWYSSKGQNEESERMRIVTAAAKILREDVRMQIFTTNQYPSFPEFEKGGQNDLPSTLTTFFQTLFTGEACSEQKDLCIERKIISLTNAVIAVIRPKSYIPPVLLGLGIHLHRKFASKELLSLLHALGFCANYKSVISFENSAEAVSMDIKLPSFIQFAFDNADFNIRTLDGNGTFHAMGGVLAVTPEEALVINPVEKKVDDRTRGKFGTAPIHVYRKPPILGLSKIKVEKIDLAQPESFRQSSLLNCLWAYGQMHNFHPNFSWQGYMSVKVKEASSFNVSKVLPLPFINLDPTNPTAIYSSLRFALDLCKKYHMTTCVVTFDQPLFLKATEIVLAANSTDEISKVVVRLGTFHLLMSFMGTIGHIMTGSGLEELWATIYAKNSVAHMTNGHAYSRALRAHLLTQSALTHLLLKNVATDDYSVSDLNELYNPNNQTENLEDHPMLVDLLTDIERRIETLQSSNRTAKLWCQYWKQVEILKLTIKADRTADWDLHLHSANSMLPFFHAAGHLPYAKSCHLYIQNMIACEKTMDNGDYLKMTRKHCNVVRRSKKFWCGTPLDMIIEQELMRRMKTSGGLTHGRGISDSTLSRWVAAMPQCLKVIEALENFSGVISVATEQHVELRDSRIERDQSDLIKLVEWLEMRNPFDPDMKELMSISSGVVANSDVNCDRAEEIGQDVLGRIIGTKYSDLRLKRNDRVKSISSGVISVKIKNTEINVNPALLFSRILCSASSPEEIKQCFKYELAQSPPSLFDEGSLRKTTKSSLYKVLDKLCPPLHHSPEDIKSYVIDGGHLLHKVVWQKPATFADVFSIYYNYITYHYGHNVTVVFDGYEEIQTKIVEQNRRVKGRKNVPTIAISDLAEIRIPQEDFLSNVANKSNFIRALGRILSEKGISIIYSSGDADTLIVTTAVDLSKNYPEGAVAVVSEDTDVMVLLIHYAERNLFMIRPGKASKPNRISSIQNLQHKLGDLKEIILSFHAISGCDTTSGLFNRGKVNLLKTVEKKNLVNLLKEFYNPFITKEKLKSLTVQFFINIYVKSKTTADLDTARYILYQQYVAKRSLNREFNLASLPPTEDAAQYHGFRVFHQVQAWLQNYLPPQEWGWVSSNSSGICPVQTGKGIAPEWVLKKIFCNCSSGGCKNACSCRQMGLKCTLTCGQCNGITCHNNSTDLALDDDS